MQCAFVSLLDILWKNGISYYRIIAVDRNKPRRELIKAIYLRLLEAKSGAINPESTFDAVDVETAKGKAFSADGIGFDGIIEVSFNLHYHGLGTHFVNHITGRGEFFRNFARL